MKKKRQPTGITVHVMDVSPLCEEASAFYRKDTNQPDHPGLEIRGTLGWVETRIGHFVLDTEGTGPSHPIGPEHPYEVLFYEKAQPCPDGAGDMLSLVPVLGGKLVHVDKIPVTTPVDLADFIRTFGTRLEANLKIWQDALAEITPVVKETA